MKKLRISPYTSVIGGLFDDEFSERTDKLFREKKKADLYHVLLSLSVERLKKLPISLVTVILLKG